MEEMTLSLINKAKNGEEIELNYSFLSDKMNELLTRYINKKIRKRNLEIKIKHKTNELTKAKNQQINEKIAQITSELDAFKKDYEAVRYMRLDLTERRRLSDIRKKIKDKSESAKKEQEELTEIKTLFDIVGVKL